MRKPVKSILFNILYGVAAIAVVLAVWAVAAAAVGTEFILPGIPSTFEALFELLTEASFWTALGFTLLRCLLSYAVSVCAFFSVFFLCSAFVSFRRIAEPILAALRTLPTLAVSLILALWAGGYYAPVVLGVTVIVPYLYSAITARNSTIPKELDEVCAINGANRWRRFAALQLPYAAAAFPESMSSAFSFNIKIVVSAEILVQTASSLGMLMNMSKLYFETAKLIALVFCTVLVSVAFELMLKSVLAVVLKRYRD